MATRNKEKLNLIRHMKMVISQLETNLYKKVCVNCNPFVVNFEALDLVNEELLLKVIVFSVVDYYSFESFTLGFYWSAENWTWRPNTDDYVNFDVILDDYAKNCDCV